jgi:hypothetical protein
MAVRKCMKQQQDEYSAFKKRLIGIVQQCGLG